MCEPVCMMDVIDSHTCRYTRSLCQCARVAACVMCELQRWRWINDVLVTWMDYSVRERLCEKSIEEPAWLVPRAQCGGGA